jgi:2-methylisocitrate lyase-like PEP mutase family enzyme
VIATFGGPSMSDYERIGVARVSCGPFTQMVAMDALARATAGLLAGGSLAPLDS